MSEPITGKPVQFVPLSSEIELPFYSALFDIKLNHAMLDDSVRTVTGAYEARVSRPEFSCKVQIAGNSLTAQYAVPRGSGRADGTLRNTNTWEDFKNLDRGVLLKQKAQQVWDAIQDGTIYSVPSLLSSFLIISYADLKKFNYTYWFAFPALHSSWSHRDEIETMGPEVSTMLVESVDGWQYRVKDSRQHGFFIAKRVSRAEIEENKAMNEDDTVSVTEDDDNGLPYGWVVDSLGRFEHGFFDGVAPEDRFVGFLDSSTYERNPGWQLRNLLVLVQQRFKMNEVNVLCYRDIHNHRDAARSIIMKLKANDPSPVSTVLPKVTGWEKNGSAFKFRHVSLSAYMDPHHLAEESVDLNLKLMKWRLVPGLNLDEIKSQKCLLLGAGTLGTRVSRDLMAWGVRHITFVDYGKVSFSNPVRQPLFTFNDCLNGGALKAETAARALKEILPSVTTSGHRLSVPMLGHAFTDGAQIREDFEKLQKLVEEHDVIFLLMDTRESRWLPTIMGKAAGKIVLNAALGFDSYVVMRHGAEIKGRQHGQQQQNEGSSKGPAQQKEAKELGCYFCNDVVTPGDSMRDQTLDQQCTVTRPGMAPIASAMLVEILASILQHPLKHHADAPRGSTPGAELDPPNHPLGIVPHQVRGFMPFFQTVVLRGEAYPQCSACSPAVLEAYRRDGWGFVERALREKDYVAEISGLAEVQRRVDEMAAAAGWDSEGGSGGSEGDGELL